MRLESGQTLSSYQILGSLGVGGMGEVYRARDEKLAREVAIKVLPAELADDPERMARFRREARMLAALNHQNIAQVHELGQADGIDFLVMEFVPGETLAERIRHHRLSVDATLAIGVQIATGLEAAHEAGVVHRDLKPANIRVTPNGLVKLLDFGLAKPVRAADPEATETRVDSFPPTEGGHVLGTPGFMAPEQVRGSPVDRRVDLWALGCVLFECLAGRRPFQGRTLFELLSAVLDREPDWSALPPDTPEPIADFLRACLVKDPFERLRDAGDARLWMARAAQEHAEEPARGRPRLRALGLAAVAGALLAAPLWFWIAPRTDAALGGPAAALEAGRLRRITGDPGLEVQPAISPQGDMIVYSAGIPGARKLYLRQVSGSQPVALTTDLPGNHQVPTWSPDGSRIVFGIEDVCWTLQALGGGLRELEGVHAKFGFDLAPDGVRIAFVEDQHVVVRNLDTGRSTRLTPGNECHSPDWSPDGQWIAYVTGNWPYLLSDYMLGTLAQSEVRIVPADGGESVLVAAGSLNTCPRWISPTELLFLSDRDGRRDLYAVEVTAGGAVGRPRRVTAGADAHSFSVSADGSRLAFSEFTSRSNIWAVRFSEDGSPVSSRSAEPVTDGDQLVEGIAVSTDGSELVFDSNRGGSQDIYLLELATGQVQQVTVDPQDDFVPDLSPDGGEIAFHSFRTGNRDLFVVGRDGKSLQQATDNPAHDYYPVWSPDGDSLAFYSSKSGQNEIWTISRPEKGAAWSEPRQLTTGGGWYPSWSPDGTHVVHGDDVRSRRLWRTEVATGERSELIQGPLRLGNVPFSRCSRDGRTVYFKAPDADGRAGVWSVPIEGGVPQLLVDFDDTSRFSVRNEFDTDGERCYFTMTEQESNVFTLELARAQP